MDIVLTVAGIALITLGLMDIFHTLLHPGGQGSLSRLVLSAFWKVSAVTRHRLAFAVGPAAMLAVTVLWVALQGIGWALIYYPHMPSGFLYASGLNAANYPDFPEALYVSFVTLTTLGYGDVVATAFWLRAVSPFEALTGFVLLTAALAWFTQLYPPLSRRRALALQLAGLGDVGYADALSDVDAVTLARVLDTLTSSVGNVRVDFTQHPEVFYFHEKNPELSLARQLPYALRLRDAARVRHEVTVRLSTQLLHVALNQLAVELNKNFSPTGERPEEVFAAYATAHRQDPRR